MGPVSYLGVAGGERSVPAKGEAERDRGEREKSRGRGERKGVSGIGNPKNPDLAQKWKLPKIPFKLPMAITFAYELRFTCTSCLRTRFDEIYNFREGNFLKFSTDQKVNL